MEPRIPGGLLVVISAPSGTGKGSLRRSLMSEWSGLSFCPSVTTRRPRQGEIEGEDYFFVSEAEFSHMVSEGKLIEWACVYGHYYGTPGEPIESGLEAGRVLLVEKDVQGAVSLRKTFPNGVFVFILPPTREELERRVRSRGTETKEELERRLGNVGVEVRCLDSYDYVIVNDNLEEAKEKLKSIIMAELCRVKRRPDIFNRWEEFTGC
ncbi:MAG TPA: guanylate kinase [Firmicutes bacterium]|nr:guanylate kinase [Bacillota bacterium]